MRGMNSNHYLTQNDGYGTLKNVEDAAKDAGRGKKETARRYKKTSRTYGGIFISSAAERAMNAEGIRRKKNPQVNKLQHPQYFPLVPHRSVPHQVHLVLGLQEARGQG